MINHNELPEIQCIYKIVNLNNPTKIYIGSTKNLRKRIYAHCNELKNNKHHSYLLQRAWNKYGGNNFNVYIMEFATDCNKEILEKKEEKYIETLEPFYNLARFANSANTTHLLKTQLKISRTMRGKNNNPNCISSTGVTNIIFNVSKKRYDVNFRVDGKKFFIGGSSTLEDAIILKEKYINYTKEELDLFIQDKRNKKHSKYVGIGYLKRNGLVRWYAYYTDKNVSSKQIRIPKYYNTELEAVRAYNNYITINKINKPLHIIKSN